jgi:hypothetical protein
MKFIKSLFRWDSDAGPVEKIITVLVPVVFLILFLWLVLASYGVGGSQLAQAHNNLRHPGSAATIATVIFLAAILWAWLNWTDRIPFQINDIAATIIIVLLIILAVNANTNFFAQVR